MRVRVRLCASACAWAGCSWITPEVTGYFTTIPIDSARFRSIPTHDESSFALRRGHTALGPPADRALGRTSEIAGRHNHHGTMTRSGIERNESECFGMKENAA